MTKFTEHVKNNYKTYLIGAGCVAAGVVGTVLVLRTSGSGNSPLQKIVQVGFRNEATPVIVELVERSTASKPVHLVGSNLYFNSLNEAARETGHSLTQLSKHVNGHIPNLGGDVFELLVPAV